MEHCPHCEECNVVMEEKIPFYADFITDFSDKVVNNENHYIETIENLQNELRLKDIYIKEILSTINKKNLKLENKKKKNGKKFKVLFKGNS